MCRAPIDRQLEAARCSAATVRSLPENPAANRPESGCPASDRRQPQPRRPAFRPLGHRLAAGERLAEGLAGARPGLGRCRRAGRLRNGLLSTNGFGLGEHGGGRSCGGGAGEPRLTGQGDENRGKCSRLNCERLGSAGALPAAGSGGAAGGC